MGNIIIMGPQASGKGTHSEYLSREYGYKHISTGDLCRAEIKRGTALGREIDELTQKGQFVSDDMVFGMLERALANDRNILDGFPRNKTQAERLDIFFAATGRTLARVIALEVPEHIAIERMGSRRYCPSCNAQYGLARMPLKENCCDADGKLLERRKDDTEEAILQRLADYKQKTASILDIYGQRVSSDGRSLLVRIDTTPPVRDIKPRILHELGLNGTRR